MSGKNSAQDVKQIMQQCGLNVAFADVWLDDADSPLTKNDAGDSQADSEDITALLKAFLIAHCDDFEQSLPQQCDAACAQIMGQTSIGMRRANYASFASKSDHIETQLNAIGNVAKTAFDEQHIVDAMSTWFTVTNDMVVDALKQDHADVNCLMVVTSDSGIVVILSLRVCKCTKKSRLSWFRHPTTRINVEQLMFIGQYRNAERTQTKIKQQLATMISKARSGDHDENVRAKKRKM